MFQESTESRPIHRTSNFPYQGGDLPVGYTIQTRRCSPSPFPGYAHSTRQLVHSLLHSYTPLDCRHYNPSNSSNCCADTGLLLPCKSRWGLCRKNASTVVSHCSWRIPQDTPDPATGTLSTDCLSPPNPLHPLLSLTLASDDCLPTR